MSMYEEFSYILVLVMIIYIAWLLLMILAPVVMVVTLCLCGNSEGNIVLKRECTGQCHAVFKHMTRRRGVRS